MAEPPNFRLFLGFSQQDKRSKTRWFGQTASLGKHYWRVAGPAGNRLGLRSDPRAEVWRLVVGDGSGFKAKWDAVVGLLACCSAAGAGRRSGWAGIVTEKLARGWACLRRFLAARGERPEAAVSGF